MTDITRSLLGSLVREVEPMYTNFVEVGHNMIEIRIKFSLVGMDHQRMLAELIVPPAIAKNMVVLLDEQVKDYENTVAPIYLPNDKRGLEGLFGTNVEKGNGV